MDMLVVALGPVFAAGFAIQQLLELLGPLLDKISQDYKKVILGLISLAAGFALAGAVPALRVLQPLAIKDTKYPDLVDLCVTALVLSAGTEGVNSILKFLKYSKEDKKNTAASKDPSNAGTGAAAAASAVALGPPGIPSAAALQSMNRK
jgi:hypothetical protein